MSISARRTSWAAWRCWKATGWRRAPAALAQLVLEEKVGALAGDRIILRDPSATRTIAGAADRRSLRPAAQSPHCRGGWPSCARCARPTPRCCRRCCGWRRASSTSRASASRATCRPAEVERLLAEAGGAKAGGLRLPRRDAGGGARRHRGHAEGVPRSNADAPGLPPERLRVALKKRWPPPVFARAARPGGGGQDGHGRRLVPAPARPFADAWRARRGAVEEDLGRPDARPLQAAAGARLRPGLRDARGRRAQADAPARPGSAGSSRSRPTSSSCGRWWPR